MIKVGLWRRETVWHVTSRQDKHTNTHLSYMWAQRRFILIFEHLVLSHRPLAAPAGSLPWRACWLCPPGPGGRSEPAGELPAGRLSLCSEPRWIHPELTSPGSDSSPGRRGKLVSSSQQHHWRPNGSDLMVHTLFSTPCRSFSTLARVISRSSTSLFSDVTSSSSWRFLDVSVALTSSSSSRRSCSSFSFDSWEILDWISWLQRSSASARLSCSWMMEHVGEIMK